MYTVQIIVSLALLANARRNLVLLVLKYATQRARTLDEQTPSLRPALLLTRVRLTLDSPFFVAAGALGYVGAKRCQPLLVMAHFLEPWP